MHEFYYDRFLALLKQGQKSVYDAQYKCLSSLNHWIIWLTFKLLNTTELDIEKLKEALHPAIAISDSQIRQCLEDLEEAELVQQTDTGWSFSVPSVSIGRRAPLLKKYHTENLEQAIQALTFPAKDRQFLNVMISTSRSKYEELRKSLEKFHKDSIHALEKGDDEILISLSSQVFLLSQK